MRLLLPASCVLFVLHVVLLSSTSGSTTSSGPETLLEFQACVNQNYSVTPTTWNSFIDRNVPARLWFERLWWQEDAPRVPLTISTHLSLSRLNQLRAQCINWAGPLVAVVHVALYQAPEGSSLSVDNAAIVQNIITQLESLYQEMRQAQPSACQLRMALLWELYDGPQAAHLYPCNALRNYAIVLAETPLVSMIDVDLIPSASLYTQFMDADRTRLNELMQSCEKGHAMVLPAFEPITTDLEEGIEVATRARNSNKQELLKMMDTRQLQAFQWNDYKRGHRATNYPAWFVMDSPYRITYQLFYEPWFIVHRSALRMYDERFRGYFYNKSLYVASVHYANTTFVAVPWAFLVHRPHRTHAARRVKEVGKPLMEEMDRRASIAVHKMRAGTYLPAVDSRLLRCAAVLPWTQHMQLAVTHTNPASR